MLEEQAGNILWFFLAILFSIFISVLLIGSSCALPPFSGVILTILRSKSTSVHSSCNASPARAIMRPAGESAQPQVPSTNGTFPKLPSNYFIFRKYIILYTRLYFSANLSYDSWVIILIIWNFLS